MGIEGEGKGVTKLMAHEYKFDAAQQRVVTGMLFTVMPLTPALSPTDGERESAVTTTPL